MTIVAHRRRIRRDRARLDGCPDLAVPECASAPELAVLVVLERVLDVTGIALLAANPHLMDDAPRLDAADALVLRLAHDLCHRGLELRHLVVRYRAAVHLALTDPAPDPGGDDIPF